MSRRQHTVLTVSIRLPLPVGWKQARLVEELRMGVAARLPAPSANTTIIKIIQRETTYL